MNPMPTPNTTPANGQNAMQRFDELLAMYEATVADMNPNDNGLANWEKPSAALYAVRAHVRKMAEDSARLDWLENNMGRVVPGSNDAKFWILGMKEFAPNKASNIRAAIDAARRTTT